MFQIDNETASYDQPPMKVWKANPTSSTKTHKAVLRPKHTTINQRKKLLAIRF